MQRQLELTHLNLAIYLIASGIPLLRITTPDSSKRKVFIFPKNKQTDELLRLYNFGVKDHYALKIDIRDVFIISRQLKEKIYSV